MNVESVGAGTVRPPSIAVKTGVEMNVAFDEAGHDQRIAEIDDLDPARAVAFRLNRNDAAATDQQIAAGAVTEPGIDEEFVGWHRICSSCRLRRMQIARLSMPCLTWSEE
ncbi:hypothetical protein ABIE91_002102 [Bradyrhizobium elkanii]|uniref:hypothetical protein n=1 Tax=Bradyrhizobium elkanii TaxID=29448 RepID=UPI003BAB4881